MRPTWEPNSKTVITIGVLFSLLNVVFIATENFWGLLLPFGLALIAAIVLALDKVLLFLVFATPLSIFYYNPDLHVGFTLPTEPITFGVMLLFFFKLLYEGGFDTKIIRHPLTIAILFYLFWIFFTSFSSQMPFVSFKVFLSRLWFISVFYFLMSQLFKKYKNIRYFFWLYMIPLSMVVIYTLYIHGQHGFTKDTSTWVMFPFFKEHTSYGAVLAMYVPIAFAFAFLLKQNLNLRVVAGIIFLILFVGVILSFTRAAWLSLILALGVMVLVLLKVRKSTLVAMTLVVLGGVWYMWGDIMQKFEKNDQVSSDNLTEHVESISNVSTDASNMERVNRWKSALRMFEERPWLGHGPGTYMFLYAPYQKPYEKTIISTNAGDMGNAHSEYIGPLAESGFIGALSVLVIVAISIVTGVKVYYKMPTRELKIIAMATLMGLITYWTHGFLNSFLEMDKAACPVWGFSALLVVLDQYFSEEKL
ncbi:lipid A core-O-antigen ligase-like enyme [Owenweeksia hongkongensis DSM 17368]|uniref:Lipid A core-O-antigen ligase-like enyme n=1 Tax=Owenweeksia hongkongensis (strain DSM 17368 / CIP 108786 / JCM 12287 / NRRL B-23963 / UST20020801) TaxID=926562 RepID=G8R1P8_OWEHD|nr:O-antigen ligase family protein [Owenweeksia hongkongensis]AEV32824.1 lipid A core-O-antigen ligase-like enyme [Owenweeksia hongkongensis DSM 17368]